MPNRKGYIYHLKREMNWREIAMIWVMRNQDLLYGGIVLASGLFILSYALHSANHYAR